MKEEKINRFWKRIINTMNDGLMLVSPEGRIEMVNQAFEVLTGYTAAEVQGKPCTILGCDACEVVLEKSGDDWCALIGQKGEEMRRCRCTLQRRDGTWIPALKNASVLRDERGRVLGTVETLTDISELGRLEEQIDKLSRRLEPDSGFCGLIGTSPAMERVYDVIQKAAQSDAPVIVYGESGTGKELVGQAIHEMGPRKDGPFIQFNCAAFNEALFESELFGHTKGAFTGALRSRIGRFEAAHGGDIFLDEIGDIPMSIQVKLLRVLESKQLERVGDHTPIPVDVRIISATNQNLKELIAAKLFRKDLFFRINVLPIHLPPLRLRKEDIPLLVRTFMRRLREKTGKDITGLSRDAMEALMRYSWPGNVRELKGALDYAFTISDRGMIRPDHLPPEILEFETDPFEVRNRGALSKGQGFFPGGGDKDSREDEKEELILALREARGNQTRAAGILGVNRVTVWHRMKKYGINLRRVLEM